MAFTYFFRDKQTLDFIVEHLVPLVTGRSRIKIWDAGCASGEEPYTFAILLAEKMGKYIFKNVEIHATDVDISNQFGDIINNGVYPYKELQRIPEALFLKYFTKTDETGDKYRISEELTSKMRYKRESLLSYIPTSTGFSLVICKNVLLHQTYEQRINILEMFYNALSDEGLLAMEQTQKLPDELAGRFIPLVSNAQLFRKNGTVK
jgi:chemotaxis protein methyltransferase CheR